MKIKKTVFSLLLSFGIANLVLAENVADKVQYQGKSRFIEISSVKVKDSNDLLMLQVEFTNTNHADRQGYYRVRWMDESGFDVGQEEPWKPLLIHGSQKQVVQIVSPTKQARDYLIQFNAENNWANDPSKQP